MVFTFLQIVIGIALIGSVLLQSQGTGISQAFGGANEFYRSKRTVERFLRFLSIVLIILFGTLSIGLLFPH